MIAGKRDKKSMISRHFFIYKFLKLGNVEK